MIFNSKSGYNIVYLLFIPLTAFSVVWSLIFGTWQLWIGTLLFTILYSGYGVSVGFHRLHSHKTFETWEPIRKCILYLGCQGAQGSPVTWSLIHNMGHHAFTDTDKDIHTPTKGLFYAFFGWIFIKSNHEFAKTELFKIRRQLDPFTMWCHKNYELLIVSNIVLIALLTGWWFGGTYIFASLNASFLSIVMSGIVNVFGHLPIKGLTYETDKTRNNSTNNPWLVFFSWGESLHNNHHYKPTRLNFNTKWYEFDVGRWLIATIKKSK